MHTEPASVDLFQSLDHAMQALDPKRHLDIESARVAAEKASKNPTLSDLEQMKRAISDVVNEMALSKERAEECIALGYRTMVLPVEWRYNEIIGRVRLNQWKDMVKAAINGEHGGVITSHAAIQPGRWQIAEHQLREGFQSATEPEPKMVDEDDVKGDSFKGLGDRIVGSHTLQLALRIVDIGNGKNVVYKGDGSGMPDNQANVNVTVQAPAPVDNTTRDEMAALKAQLAEMRALLESATAPAPAAGKKV